MARVTAYEATDGTLHRDRKAYLQHESNLVVAQKLKTIIAGKVSGADDASRTAAAANIYDFIVNDIGLTALRELLAFQFKPNNDDGDAAGASTGGDATAQASTATSTESGADASAPAAAGADAAAAPATSDI